MPGSCAPGLLYCATFTPTDLARDSDDELSFNNSIAVDGSHFYFLSFLPYLPLLFVSLSLSLSVSLSLSRLSFNGFPGEKERLEKCHKKRPTSPTTLINLCSLKPCGRFKGAEKLTLWCLWGRSKYLVFNARNQ